MCDLRPGISVSDKVRGLKWLKEGESLSVCVCVCVCVCVGVGVRCLVRLCVSAYYRPCRTADDIMAHDCRTTERMPPVFFADGDREEVGR